MVIESASNVVRLEFFWTYAAAIGALLAATGVFHWFVKQAAVGDSAAAKRGLWGLVVGQDNRTSTSKLQAALWTYVLIRATTTAASLER